MTVTDLDYVAVKRIRQVFDFLKALSNQRNPSIRQIKEQPWSFWLDELPAHPSISFPQRLISPSNNGDGESVSPYLLCVRRPNLTPPPPLPEGAQKWVLPGWDDPKKEPEFLATRNESAPDGQTITMRREDDHELQQALSDWQVVRNAWKVAELPARNAKRTFDRLYELHGQLQREAERYDLVIGDGILSWQREAGNIFHPVLLQCVQLVFDSQNAEFRIVDSDRPSELYLGLFQSDSDVVAQPIRNLKAQFEEAGYHPLDLEVEGMLRSLANLLSSQGTFTAERPQSAAEHPSIGRSPVLFLRSRTRGFGAAIDTVLSTLHERTDFCPALKALVGCEPSDIRTYDPPDQAVANGPERPVQDILFGKPANHDQLRIARAVTRYGSVLVQGPPGTGKSHTIANLIGHLLAQGKSVLVTSHTTKALRVLREQVVEELRPLCVSVLDSDLLSREQLEQSIQAISSRLTVSDPDQLDREATRLEEQRAFLIRELQQTQDALLKARTDEYREITFGGTGISPSDAARIIAAGGGVNDWIPGPVALGEPCPLSQAETSELYSSTASTSAHDDEYLDLPLPDLDLLPAPDVIADILQHSTTLDARAEPNLQLWKRGLPAADNLEEIHTLIARLKQVSQDFSTFEDWKLAAVEAGRRKAPNDSWTSLLKQIQVTYARANEIESDRVIFRPEIAEDISFKEQRDLAKQIEAHLEKQQTLRWHVLLFRPQWKRMLTTWRVRGGMPRSAEQIRAIRNLLTIRIARGTLKAFWNDLMAANGLSPFEELGDTPEAYAYQLSHAIDEAIQWWSAEFQPLIERVEALGFDWNRLLQRQQPDIRKFGEMRRMISAAEYALIWELEHVAVALESQKLKATMETARAALASAERPEAEQLDRALRVRDVDLYRRAFVECKASEERRALALRRRDLLQRLLRPSAHDSPLSPAWAECIRTRAGVHGGPLPPGDVNKAWEYRQLSDELDRRATVDVDLLVRRAGDIQDEIKMVTNQLIERKAWASQVRRTTTKQRQSLTGWLGMIKKIGKGTGKRVPELRKAAQIQMEESRSAVPVWIMPLSQITENFDFAKSRFDVVIIDEASQCDVMAYLAFVLGKRIVIVGDDKQVSPTAVGQEVEKTSKLINFYLEGVPNAPLYDGKTSIYELAHTTLPSIMLHEHFRCVPNIIQFSNHLSYNGDIKPLREESSSSLMPHLINYRVEGFSRRSGKVNEEEAVAIASLIVAATEHHAYANQTIGVISLLGDEQAKRIDSLLRMHLPVDKHERHRVICGNSAQFQGDERDVMFLSMVDSPTGGPLRMKSDVESQKRYNVAASRARNQMWVVHSLNHEIDLKPGDLRRRLIEHAIDPEAITRELEQANPVLESPFEKEVHARLVRQGYLVHPQWPVGSYRIDMVVEGTAGRVAIECDGDRYHPIDKIPEDMARQAILERLGWRFIRIRGSVFFRQPDQEMQKVFARLVELGIEPQARSVEKKTSHSQSDIVNAIIRRAAELRAEWTRPDIDEETETNDEEADFEDDDSDGDFGDTMDAISDIVK